MKSETHLYILALVFMSFLWPVWATASEFKMLLRLWPHHHTDDSLKNELLAALEDYPGLWDEAWFFMGYNTLLSEKHNCSARKMGGSCPAAESHRNKAVCAGTYDRTWRRL